MSVSEAAEAGKTLLRIMNTDYPTTQSICDNLDEVLRGLRERLARAEAIQEIETSRMDEEEVIEERMFFDAVMDCIGDDEQSQVSGKRKAESNEGQEKKAKIPKTEEEKTSEGVTWRIRNIGSTIVKENPYNPWKSGHQTSKLFSLMSRKICNSDDENYDE